MKPSKAKHATRSKYKPHQGAKEQARRRRQRDGK